MKDTRNFLYSLLLHYIKYDLYFRVKEIYMLKLCRGCNQTKELSEFSRDKWCKDGLSYRCRSCKSKKWSEYKMKERLAKIPVVKRGIESSLLRRSYADIARTLFSAAVSNGSIVRPNACSVCGKACKPHGHHPDYAKPYEVIWLCPKCHGAERRRGRSGINSHVQGCIVFKEQPFPSKFTPR